MFTRGDVIRKWRESKGWTAEKLVEKTGLNKNTITNVEANRRAPRESTLECVVRTLGHSMGELYTAVALYGDGKRVPAPLVSLVEIARHLSHENQIGLAKTAQEFLAAERALNAAKREIQSPSEQVGAPSPGKRAGGRTSRQ